MALAIIFDGNPGNIFYAGQCVTGHVRFQTSERITMRGMLQFSQLSLFTVLAHFELSQSCPLM